MRAAKEQAKVTPQHDKRGAHETDSEDRQCRENTCEPQDPIDAVQALADFLVEKLDNDLPDFLARAEKVDMERVVRILRDNVKDG